MESYEEVLELLNDPTGKSLVLHVIYSNFSGYVKEKTETDDLVGQGYLGLAIALKQYNKDKGDFARFAYVKVKQSVLDYLRLKNTKNTAKIFPLVDTAYMGETGMEFEYKHDIRLAMKCLTKTEKKIIRKIFFRHTPERQAAKALKLGRSTISKYKKNALLKMRMFLNEKNIAG